MNHRYISILSLAAILSATGLNAEVYQYKNEQGQTVFTDEPVSGSKPVEISPVMTYTPQVKPLAPASEAVQQDPSVGAYESIRITSPQQEGTVRDNQGIVRVRYESVPPLQKGDRPVLYLNGQQHDTMDVMGLSRGEYKAQVAIVDINGTEKIKSDVVTFYLHHQSKLFKAN